MGIFSEMFPNKTKAEFYREMWASLLTYMVLGLFIGFMAAAIGQLMNGTWNWYLALVPCVVTSVIWFVLVVGAYILGWIAGGKEKE